MADGGTSSKSGPRLGILLPTRGLVIAEDGAPDFGPLLSMAEAAEEAGLDSLWVGDSLTAKPRPEPLMVLAAVAARTRRVRLGTAVLLAALRHPVLLAHLIGTLELISGGRTVLAVGVGGAFNREQRQEWWNAGVDPSRRGSRLEEVVEIVKRLSKGEEVSYKGRHFNLDSVSIRPKSPRAGGVPILMACHLRAQQEIQFRRAGRLADGFISISDRPEEYAQVRQKVGSYASEFGKELERMEAAFYMTVNLDRDESKAKEDSDRFLHLYYGANIWGDRWGPFGAPERTAERIQQYVEAGVGTVIVRFSSFEQEKQLDTFLNEVVPAI